MYNYYLIKGKFHVLGHSPDGDSVKFEANNNKHWKQIDSHYQSVFEEALNAKKDPGIVQTRLQGIDALETHYRLKTANKPTEIRKAYSKAKSKVKERDEDRPVKANVSQPKEQGKGSTHRLLNILGIEEDTIVWAGNWIREIKLASSSSPTAYKKSQRNKKGIDGYILVTDFDRKGRPLIWMFGGNPPKGMRDGSKWETADVVDLIEESVNYKLLEEGLVYPYFYFTLESRLRHKLVDAVNKAKGKWKPVANKDGEKLVVDENDTKESEKLGIWKQDTSTQGVKLKDRNQLEEKFLIYPYLFRKLVNHQYKCQMMEFWEASLKKKRYTPQDEDLFLDRFFEDANPYVYLLRDQNFVKLDSVVQIKNGKLKLTEDPGNFVFLP